MSEWIKVKLTGHLCFKLIGVSIMGLCLILGLTAIRSNLSEQLVGFLLAGLFLFFLLGYGVYYWANSRYLLANPQTKEIRFQQLLKKEQIFSLNDLTSITILKYNVHIERSNICYSFHYNVDSRDFITFLKTNSPLWNRETEEEVQEQPLEPFVIEPEPVLPKECSRLLYAHRLLLLLILLFLFILLLNLTRHLIVLVLLFSILVSAFLMHLADCMLLSKMYNAILSHGTTLSGTLCRFSHHTGGHSIPYFIFQDKKGTHEVPGLLSMNLTKKEEADAIGEHYTIWYAPVDSSSVLYGHTEPEPLPVRYFNFLLIGQLFVVLIFLVLLFYTSFPGIVRF